MSLRSQRTMSRLMSTGMRLTADNPPLWPLDFAQFGTDGRIRVVSADGIWLGHLQRRAAASFEDYSEFCLPNAGLIDIASLIPSECGRWFVRLCLTHPEKSIVVTADRRRSTFLALALFVPAAPLTDSLVRAPSPVAVRMHSLLGMF